MKLVVMADNHGDMYSMRRIVNMHRDAYDFIHLGDSEGTLRDMQIDFPEVHFTGVRGNCDFTRDLPGEEVLTYGGKKIFCCHGHMHNVKSGIGYLQKLAEENGYDIVLFGHTHQRFEHYENGVYYFNPGSCARPRDGQPPSFGVIEIRDNGILMSHGSL